MKVINLIIIGLLFMINACNSKIEKKDSYGIGLKPCAGEPAYISKTPINKSFAALTTSEKRVKGIALIDIKTQQIWQHPSWSKFGSMGPICTDEKGNTYVASVPVINILDNKLEKQNTIYQINSSTGEMAEFFKLPISELSGVTNPYGIVGLHYDCHAGYLFASSVLGSKKESEEGVIYSLDITNKAVNDKLENIDAMGMALSGLTGQKRLYFGKCRRSEIYSIEVSKEGKYRGEPKFEFSLDMLGPRGDDIARKITFNSDGVMIIKGVSFDYNLTAPTEKLETTYNFIYDRNTEKWIFLSSNQ